MIRAALAAIVFAAGAAAAADGYPQRPIRMIAPFAPGGGAEVYCRLLARKFSDLFGQQVVVDNRAGANGIIGTDMAAKEIGRAHV